MESMKSMGEKAKIAAVKTQLHAEIEVKKTSLKAAKKDFGFEVWDAMVANDQPQIDSIFSKHKEQIDKLLEEIKERNDKLDEIHKSEK